MPANLSPEYKQAEEAYRAAREPQERLSCLKEMLRAIPKHKGTEHLQADIKSRIKQLTDDLTSAKKAGARTGPTYIIRAEGAAQVALIGPPNAGKSTLHQNLTGSKTDIGPYPFTTHVPVPGMFIHEDVHFQLVDLPPVSADYMEPWFINALQPADAAMLVVDLADPACVEQVQTIIERLSEKKVQLTERWPGFSTSRSEPSAADDDDPFRIVLPTMLVANKADLDPDPGEVDVLEELLGVRYPAVSVTATTGDGLDTIGPLLFEGLEVLRVYTKTPGKQAEDDRPFTVRKGATVHDVARLVHKEVADSLQFARLWGKSGQFAGQQVGPDHEVADRDVVELHMR